MKSYISGVLQRSVRQFFFFIGRSLVLSLILIFFSSGIRGAGDAYLGRSYYYLVMPGVVCHETAHAAACLCTGKRIVEFAPFKPHGNVLGYVQWDSGEITPGTLVAAFLVGTAPLWFGCAVAWLLCGLLARTGFLPDYRTAAVLYPYSSGPTYWKQVVRSAFAMMRSVLKKWSFNLVLNIVILYFLFCIVSEMPPSLPDLRMSLPGIVVLALFFICLNLIPFIGLKAERLTVKLQALFFILHTIIVFVIFLDLLLWLVVVLPPALLL